MIDDLVGLAIAAVIDVEARKAAKHRWMRIFQGFVGVLFLVAVVGLIYITLKYS